MVQWFKKKKTQTRILEFNKKKLLNEINNLSDNLYEYRNETSLKIVKEVIDMAMNIQLLDVNLCVDPKDTLIHKGRVQALSDISSYIDRAMSERPSEKAPRGTMNAYRKRKIQEDMVV